LVGFFGFVKGDAEVLALDVADGGVLDVDDEIRCAAADALGFIGGGYFLAKDSTSA